MNNISLFAELSFFDAAELRRTPNIGPYSLRALERILFEEQLPGIGTFSGVINFHVSGDNGEFRRQLISESQDIFESIRPTIAWQSASSLPPPTKFIGAQILSASHAFQAAASQSGYSYTEEKLKEYLWNVRVSAAQVEMHMRAKKLNFVS